MLSEMLQSPPLLINKFAVAAEVHADAKMRVQSILETQRVEIEQLREYRSISSKLNGEIEENAREKAHLESAMKTLRHEVDKLRHENLQIRTQLSKLNPIQTSLEIELDKARGVENDLKKEIMILRAEVEKETKARHELTRREANRSQLIDKERREIVDLRTESTELRNEISKLQRKNEDLEDSKVRALEASNLQKDEFHRIEERHKERINILQEKIYSLKRANKETEIGIEKKSIELRSAREELHNSNLRLQELHIMKKEDMKKLSKDIEETKEMFEDKKQQVEVLSNSVTALEDDKHYLLRKVQHLEGQVRSTNEEIDAVRTTSEMKVNELETSLHDAVKETERYRSKHEDLKRLMLREASEVVSDRLVANKFNRSK